MITVIGSINLDLIARVDRLPERGETVPGTGFSTAPGGKGANQALAVARTNSNVRMVGAVGRDAFAGEALALLKAAGVDLGSVAETDQPTGTALILVGSDGENMIAVVPGANATVTPDIIGGLSFVENEHVLLQHEIPLESVEAALDAVRDAGGISLLNTAPYRAEAVRYLHKADYVIANETEFDLYANQLGIADQERLHRIWDFAAKIERTAVVTLGADGVVVATPGQAFEIKSLSITPVDTVGAGDTFCGYLGAGLAHGMSVDQAARGAAVAGALACLKPGAQPSIPYGHEVDEALRHHMDTEPA